MMISCPRCKTMVSDDIAHCNECGYSIKNYLQNKNNYSAYHAENDNKTVNVLEKKISEQEKDCAEDNILKFLSNIKIVKDESYDAKNDELDGNMHAFLVEALNDSYKIRSVTTVIKKPKEYLELEEDGDLAKKTNDSLTVKEVAEQETTTKCANTEKKKLQEKVEESTCDEKEDRQEKAEESACDEKENRQEVANECIAKENESVEKEENNIIEDSTAEIKANLKLEEPENDTSLELVELNICELENKKDDITNKKDVSKGNLELNTYELEIIHKRKIKLPEEFEVKNGLIIKGVSEEKNYDKFYDTISSLRKDKYNKKAIFAVASATGLFVAIVVLISELIIG